MPEEGQEQQKGDHESAAATLISTAAAIASSDQMEVEAGGNGDEKAGNGRDRLELFLSECGLASHEELKARVELGDRFTRLISELGLKGEEDIREGMQRLKDLLAKCVDRFQRVLAEAGVGNEEELRARLQRLKELEAAQERQVKGSEGEPETLDAPLREWGVTSEADHRARLPAISSKEKHIQTTQSQGRSDPDVAAKLPRLTHMEGLLRRAKQDKSTLRGELKAVERKVRDVDMPEERESSYL